MASRIQLRRGTAANWASTNPVLAQGELGVETDTGVVKAGDGTTNWASLKPVLSGTYALKANGVDPKDVGFDVILLVGQSNMVGNTQGGLDTTYLDAPSPRVLQYANTSSATYANKIVSGVDPLFHRDQQPNTVGQGTSFGRLYSLTRPENRRILLVPAARSGCGFTTSTNPTPPAGYVYYPGTGTGCWDPSGADGGVNLYQAAVDQTNAAIATNPNNRIVAIVWCQGEADTALSQSAYAAKLDSLIDGFRANITGAANVPFLIAQMLPENIAKGGGIAGINAAHIDTPRRKTLTSFYYGPTGYGNSDVIHYTAAGQRLLGARAFDALALAQANVTGTAPVPPGAPILTQSGTSVTVTWPRPVCRFTDFKVEYQVGGGSWSTLTRTASLDSTATITGLTLGTSVNVRVSTVNEQGTSAPSSTTGITLATLPGQVTGLTAGTPGSGSMPLTWTAVSGASSYLVEYKATSSGTWLTASTVTATSATVPGLSAQTSYDFRVSASNAAGAGSTSSVVTASTSASSPALSDIGVSAYRAVSLRKVSATATKAIQVRRSSDNTLQDIAFKAGTNDLDTAALLSFVGSGDGYIQTWYDQSGNGRDVTQTTAANQARIVGAGTLDTANGRPAAVFNGTSTVYLDTTNAALFNAGAMSILAVANGATGANRALCAEGNATTPGRWALYGSSSNAQAFTAYDDSGVNWVTVSNGTAPLLTNGLIQTSLVDSGTAANGWVNATADIANANTTRTGHTMTTTRFVMGAGAAGSGSTNNLFWSGSISELLTFTSALTTAQRQAGESNEKAYYATP